MNQILAVGAWAPWAACTGVSTYVAAAAVHGRTGAGRRHFQRAGGSLPASRLRRRNSASLSPILISSPRGAG